MLVAVCEQSLEEFAVHQKSSVKSIMAWRAKGMQQFRLQPRHCHTCHLKPIPAFILISQLCLHQWPMAIQSLLAGSPSLCLPGWQW